MHRLRLGLFRVAIVADAERIAAALRYQQELEAAQRPATMNPNLAAQGTSSRNRLAAALSSQNSNPIAEFARQAVSLDPQPDQGYGTMAAEMALGFVPGVGQAMAARDIERARRDNDPVGMGMAASSFVPFGKLIGGLRKPMSELITYHGTPHRFPPTANNPLGEFDPMKIGTGEGAQAYGVGAGYLAEAKDLAKTYQPRDIANEEGLLKLYNAAEKKRDYSAMEVLENAMLHKTPEELRGIHGNAGEKVIKQIEKIPRTVGNLYKVDLPDEQIAKMLDWDKPLSQQSWYRPVADVVKEYKGAGKDVDAYAKLISKANARGGEVTGGQLYEGMLSQFGGDQAKVSEFMREAGIPGIRYLDQGSRAGGSGTSNFVVFDPKHMNIIGRE